MSAVSKFTGTRHEPLPLATAAATAAAAAPLPRGPLASEDRAPLLAVRAGAVPVGAVPYIGPAACSIGSWTTGVKSSCWSSTSLNVMTGCGLFSCESVLQGMPAGQS